MKKVIIDSEIIYKAFFEDDGYSRKLFMSAENGLLGLFLTSYSLLKFVEQHLKVNDLSLEFISTLVSINNLNIIKIDPEVLKEAYDRYIKYNGSNNLEYHINATLLLNNEEFNFYLTYKPPERSFENIIISPKKFIISHF